MYDIKTKLLFDAFGTVSYSFSSPRFNNDVATAYSLRPSDCLSVSWSVFLTVCLSVCRYVFLSVSLLICLSFSICTTTFFLPAGQHLYLFVSVSITLALSVYLSVCPVFPFSHILPIFPLPFTETVFSPTPSILPSLYPLPPRPPSTPYPLALPSPPSSRRVVFSG